MKFKDIFTEGMSRNTLTKDGSFKNIDLGNLNEGIDADEMMELIGDLDGKGAQVAWNWFEDNLGDSDIYAGDAVPEDYLEIMSDKQIKTLFKLIKKYL